MLNAARKLNNNRDNIRRQCVRTRCNLGCWRSRKRWKVCKVTNGREGGANESPRRRLESFFECRAILVAAARPRTAHARLVSVRSFRANVDGVTVHREPSMRRFGREEKFLSRRVDRPKDAHWMIHAPTNCVSVSIGNETIKNYPLKEGKEKKIFETIVSPISTRRSFQNSHDRFASGERSRMEFGFNDRNF